MAPSGRTSGSHFSELAAPPLRNNQRIYTIRGVKVMLDADLAEIYGYETRFFNRQVKNNIDRFAEDFRFQLNEDEMQNLMCKKCTSSWGGTRKLPYAFTEQGIYMLMTVLKGDLAIRQSKALIRLFKQMKDYIVAENHQLLGTAGIAQIAAQTVQNTHEIAAVSAEVKELSGEVRDIRSDLGKINVDLRMVMENFVDPSSFRHFLILNGHKLEADVAYAQIYGMAKKSVLIVDNYVDVKTLNLLQNVRKGVSVLIFSDLLGGSRLTDDMLADYRAARPEREVTRGCRLPSGLIVYSPLYHDNPYDSRHRPCGPYVHAIKIVFNVRTCRASRGFHGKTNQ